MILSSFAPAKVNLFLHVTGKRDDGYHLLDSLAVFPAVGDRLSFEPDGILGLTIGGPFGATLTAEPDNLVLRAARLLAAKAGVPAVGRLHLEKNLPVASGIGGGSADAAACLRLLAGYWGVAARLEQVALALGADVPVCLASRPSRMEGVGEILSPGPVLPAFGMLLVNPGIPVSTAAVFRARPAVFSPAAFLPEAWSDAAGMTAWLSRHNNDLEAPAIELAPGIAAVLAALRELPGVLMARMSGSGATCFAVFKTATEAADAAFGMRQGWWCWGGGLYEAGRTEL